MLVVLGWVQIYPCVVGQSADGFGWVTKNGPMDNSELSHLYILCRLGAEICPVDTVPLMWDSMVGEERSEASDFLSLTTASFINQSSKCHPRLFRQRVSKSSNERKWFLWLQQFVVLADRESAELQRYYQ